MLGFGLGVGRILAVHELGGDVRGGLAELAARLRSALGTSVELTELGADSGARHYGLDVYVASVNDVLEFAIQTPLAPDDDTLAAFLGWQAAGQEIARWEMPQGADVHRQLEALLEEAYRRVVEMARMDEVQ